MTHQIGGKRSQRRRSKSSGSSSTRKRSGPKCSRKIKRGRGSGKCSHRKRKSRGRGKRRGYCKRGGANGAHNSSSIDVDNNKEEEERDYDAEWEKCMKNVEPLSTGQLSTYITWSSGFNVVKDLDETVSDDFWSSYYKWATTNYADMTNMFCIDTQSGRKNICIKYENGEDGTGWNGEGLGSKNDVGGGDQNKIFKKSVDADGRPAVLDSPTAAIAVVLESKTAPYILTGGNTSLRRNRAKALSKLTAKTAAAIDIPAETYLTTKPFLASINAAIKAINGAVPFTSISLIICGSTDAHLARFTVSNRVAEFTSAESFPEYASNTCKFERRLLAAYVIKDCAILTGGSAFFSMSALDPNSGKNWFVEKFVKGEGHLTLFIKGGKKLYNHCFGNKYSVGEDVLKRLLELNPPIIFGTRK